MRKSISINAMVLFFIFGLFSLGFSQETMTITTYYPSPYGNYRELTAHKLKIGRTYSVASPLGPTVSDDNAIIEGNLGIGTTNPNQRFVVNGTGVMTNRLRVGIAPFNDDANIGGNAVGLRVVEKLLYVGPEVANLPQGNSVPADAWIAAGNAPGCSWGNRRYGVIGVGYTAGVYGQIPGDILGIGWSVGALGYQDGTIMSGIFGDRVGVNGHAGYFRGPVYVSDEVTIGTLNTDGFRLRVAGGNAAVDAGSSWTTVSDVRLKKDIRALGPTLDKVVALRGVRYHTLQENTSDAGHIGFIAQEMEKEFPEIVVTGKDGYKGIDYGKVTPVLIEAVKDLKAENEALKSRIEALEVKLSKSNL